MSSAGIETIAFPSTESQPSQDQTVHRIRSDQEAISAAREIATLFETGASERDRNRRLPQAEIELLTRSGLLGITIPKAFGGPSVSHVTLVEVFAILAAADSSLGQIPHNHFCVVDAIYPLTISQIGDLEIRLHAAEALLQRAARTLDVGEEVSSDATVASVSVAVAEAKVLTTEIAILATNKLFELAGTQSTLGKYNLDRHWRNARTHTLHDPVRWKYYAIGNYYLKNVNTPHHPWN